MKYLLLVLSIIFTVAVCHAQKSAKNEFTLSYYPAVYFFDDEGIDFSPFSGSYMPLFSYTRNHSSRFSSAIAYNNYRLLYLENLDVSYEYRLARRSLQRISLYGVYTIPAGWMWFRMKAGLNYCWGEKRKIRNYPCPFLECLPDINLEHYNRWGAVASTNINHKIAWGIFGSLQADYVRMFKGIDPNQLYVSYSLGYRF